MPKRQAAVRCAEKIDLLQDSNVWLRKGRRTMEAAKRGVVDDRSESHHQQAVVRYLRRDPKKLFTAPCNGVEMKPHTRSFAKRMGMTCGVPDLLIFDTRGPYLGLAIEMKRATKPSRVSNEQKECISRLRRRGWYASVCYGEAEACDLIDWYYSHRQHEEPSVQETYSE